MKILIILLNVALAKKASEEGEMKVKDHDPLLGNFQDSVHQGCNLNVSLRKKVSVVFYNLQNYDSHLISQEIGRNNFKINVIPKITEK